jgi:hypothetical protein
MGQKAQEGVEREDPAQPPAAAALGLNDSALVRIMLESQTEMEMLQTALG